MLLGGLALALTVGSRVARADEPLATGVPDAATRAEQLIQEGVDLRTEGREREALDKFREAHRLQPSPRAQAQMGLAAKSLRLYVEAERHLVDALAAPNDPWIAQGREALELALRVVSRQLASLVVRSNVTGAALLVDGTPVAELPLQAPVRVPAGAARIEVRAPGHSPSLVDATLPAERTTEVTLDLVRQAVPVAPPRATVRAPVERPATPSASLRPWAYLSGGVGLAGLGVGTVFGLMAVSEKQAQDEQCPNGVCTSAEGEQHNADGKAYATVATIAFAAGAVGVGAAVVLWLLEPNTPRTAAVGRWSF
jgi:hypothetical protein